MPRRIPSQVPQTVSRLLESGFFKTPPAWFEAVNNHPPVIVPARHPVQRPDEDLPRRLRSTTQTRLSKVGSSSKTSVNSQQQQWGRDPTNSKKKSRTLTPKLTPKPIVYDEDKVRQQFFRDHPWEAYRPKTLVEMSAQVGDETRVHGDPKRLRSYGRNPSVEDLIVCTLAAHRQGGLSLSQAYHNTLSSYHGLKAEHEHATRYATLEANYYGADLGKTETQRGFEKEDKALESWAVWANGGLVSEAGAELQQTKAARVKRTDATFTRGEAYLQAANAFKEGKVSADRLNAGVETKLRDDSAAMAPASNLGDAADDFLGLAKSAVRPTEVSSESQASAGN
ncbi:related to RSM25 - mitochondrial ribosomal protein, small subunit [Melanopsichium pennsylvanicum]|uniref:Small ribosomal subunit protein mS23 n=2 Tax=Melanopsichium pennsylvanicum TaxID=63383 RepID=A0AAJ4XIX6_9BASI|nr:related to RSM25-mitochondrial ribosomal protein, small subunit [Melanopsichium pennsylvanicum 4]SNX82526.1 related to RSM25 - mitochondrial ribosomal protein, small subunit [Melanopsichium pennsylvanicum]